MQNPHKWHFLFAHFKIIHYLCIAKPSNWFGGHIIKSVYLRVVLVIRNFHKRIGSQNNVISRCYGLVYILFRGVLRACPQAHFRVHIPIAWVSICRVYYQGCGRPRITNTQYMMLTLFVELVYS